MSKNNIILSVGIILLLIPFLGFPSNWENFIDIAFGIVLVGLSFSVIIKRRSSVPKGRRRRKSDMAPMFVDAAGAAPEQTAQGAENATTIPKMTIDTSL